MAIEQEGIARILARSDSADMRDLRAQVERLTRERDDYKAKWEAAASAAVSRQRHIEQIEHERDDYAQAAEVLRNEVKRLTSIAAHAGGLVEEIVRDGTHKSWKRVAAAIRSYNEPSTFRVDYSTDVTAADVERIDKLVAPEFATGDWETVESEAGVIEQSPQETIILSRVDYDALMKALEATEPNEALRLMQTPVPWE
jgi:hypothetical protein